MTPLLLLGLTIVFFCICFVRVRLKARRLASLDFEGLLGLLKPVSSAHIATIALDYLQPTPGQLVLEPEALWTLIGGYEGVNRLYANAEVLIALAGYAQRWNPEESLIVAERMRRDGLTLRGAALRLNIAPIAGRTVFTPFDVQELVSAYFLMRGRLLALYESSHIGRYPALLAAL